MKRIRSIEENTRYYTSEVVCLGCLHRWIAVRPWVTKLKDLECPRCKMRGFVIETGENTEG